MSEHGLPLHQWKKILAMVQTCLKHDITPKHGHNPNQIFMGRKGNGFLFSSTSKSEKMFPLISEGLIWVYDSEKHLSCSF